ncbi:MAG: 3-methyl-2-oxobutanoate hydroxymethyltransferase [Planctomycetia bacterium]|nr:MAG: 3-methyl-2-oxobutanoate hydroxymethyltransferase [Planctomycetia bacterium]
MPAYSNRVDLAFLRQCKSQRRKFAMLTAYDHPTAVAAQAAGVHSLLVGDSMGAVILGHPNTRSVPLALMITLAEAVRRGAPDVYLVGDMPFESMSAGNEAVIRAALRFRDDAGCDAVKLETAAQHDALVAKLSRAGIETIAHLGLRPQSVLNPDGYKAQARDEGAVAELVADARRMESAGAAMLLLEAVPAEAASAVVAAVSVPVIGCGAGPACDGHVVVTHDLLGWGATRPPRFVPVLASLGETVRSAMAEYVQQIATGTYPGPEHAYSMRAAVAAS